MYSLNDTKQKAHFKAILPSTLSTLSRKKKCKAISISFTLYEIAFCLLNSYKTSSDTAEVNYDILLLASISSTFMCLQHSRAAHKILWHTEVP